MQIGLLIYIGDEDFQTFSIDSETSQSYGKFTQTNKVFHCTSIIYVHALLPLLNNHKRSCTFVLAFCWYHSLKKVIRLTRKELWFKLPRYLIVSHIPTYLHKLSLKRNSLPRKSQHFSKHYTFRLGGSDSWVMTGQGKRSDPYGLSLSADTSLSNKSFEKKNGRNFMNSLSPTLIRLTRYLLKEWITKIF